MNNGDKPITPLSYKGFPSLGKESEKAIKLIDKYV